MKVIGSLKARETKKLPGYHTGRIKEVWYYIMNANYHDASSRTILSCCGSGSASFLEYPDPYPFELNVKLNLNSSEPNEKQNLNYTSWKFKYT
jgi:hypothetical protein